MSRGMLFVTEKRKVDDANMPIEIHIKPDEGPNDFVLELSLLSAIALARKLLDKVQKHRF